MDDLLLHLQEERFLLFTPSFVVYRLPPVFKLSVVSKPDPADQVALEGELINRVRFAYNGQFEDWRETGYNSRRGEEQEPFFLQVQEKIVQVTTYASESESPLTGFSLCGLELSTSTDRSMSWGQESSRCKRSVTKDTFLAFCSGGIEAPLAGGEFPFLTFHWMQNKPTVCN